MPTTIDSKHKWQPHGNLARGLQTTAINQLWVADITYIRLRQQFVFAAVVLDAHSRRVIGWAVEDNLGASLAIRHPPPGMIHHSDRGIQGGFNRSSQQSDLVPAWNAPRN